jgi:hypothetical protein
VRLSAIVAVHASFFIERPRACAENDGVGIMSVTQWSFPSTWSDSGFARSFDMGGAV